MKIKLISFQIISALTVLLAFAGCKKSSPAALAPEKVPAAVAQAFNQSSGETKEIAANVATDCQGQDAVKAFGDLQALSRRTDLTPEQRATTAQAMVGVFTKLRTDSENGDAAAQAAVKQYLSSK